MLTVVTDKFAAANPVVTDLLRNVTFTNKQMGSVLAWQEANKASADEAAVHFLTTYTDVWGGWLNADAKAKLSSLLK